MSQMARYRNILDGAPNPYGRSALLSYLDSELPPLWRADYTAMTKLPSDLLIIPFRDGQDPDSFLNVMFDHASGAAGASGSGTEDRVVAVWGLSRSEPADTRDTGRMAGFLKGVWSRTYPGRDRGHFFAHTMGGGTDINLFPQSAHVNRGGQWRKMERYAVSHPGTFCFIHPIYAGTSWIPTSLEYGIYKMPPERLQFCGADFPN